MRDHQIQIGEKEGRVQVAKRWQSQGVMNTSDVSSTSHSEPETTHKKNITWYLENEIILTQLFEASLSIPYL